MKFGKNLLRIVDLSDPEWGPYWINYKYLKKCICDIVEEQGRSQKIVDNTSIKSTPLEVDFFRALRAELKKCSDFFASTEQLYRIRHARVLEGYKILKSDKMPFEKNVWTRLLAACVKFYKDVLLLENFAIMNYCGFSKILKKHDKLTGYMTRDAFMRNVMSQQNFTHYPYVLTLLKESEELFLDIQSMESNIPLHQDEKLFIDAIRDLNSQAIKLQEQENLPWTDHYSSSSSSLSSSSAVSTTSATMSVSGVGSHTAEPGYSHNPYSSSSFACIGNNSGSGSAGAMAGPVSKQARLFPHSALQKGSTGASDVIHAAAGLTHTQSQAQQQQQTVFSPQLFESAAAALQRAVGREPLCSDDSANMQSAVSWITNISSATGIPPTTYTHNTLSHTNPLLHQTATAALLTGDKGDSRKRQAMMMLPSYSPAPVSTKSSTVQQQQFGLSLPNCSELQEDPSKVSRVS